MHPRRGGISAFHVEFLVPNFRAEPHHRVDRGLVPYQCVPRRAFHLGLPRLFLYPRIQRRAPTADHSLGFAVHFGLSLRACLTATVAVSCLSPRVPRWRTLNAVDRCRIDTTSKKIEANPFINTDKYINLLGVHCAEAVGYR
jgi:hypothetical protein